ncbi:MAG: cupin domain-containing protein [Chloroflexi bacterium]|jgi:mannose-6-phosphate isomerase-like protein (cupin superfamily)|nr:cupin domain-containing protein [Chloroflexota bacterium]MBT4074265.1 cupin domain-containing protein [Chloroflexota bacterium]MBT4515628.1 cupin domain-containing protein [Chloroflexota bacterium]MBT5320437.1 cupin domain-containing protein [Chloroflexota bacterium]MBT6683021.1 cupin domain-containing protein [Chloroflexota bacterium]
MSVIRNWKEVIPYIGHDFAIIWPIFRSVGWPDRTPDDAPLQGMAGFTVHRMQGNQAGDYHDHEDQEQVYYFIKGSGQMKLDGEIIDVEEGDSVHIPAKVMHQFINNSDDWCEHVLVTGGTINMPYSGTTPSAFKRNWKDIVPYVRHDTAIIWGLFMGAGREGVDPQSAVMRGMDGFTVHRMQGRLTGEYHSHEDQEQVYYFIKGSGQMKLDGEIRDVREGDAVYVPPKVKHQLINNTEDWCEHLLVTANVDES